MGIKQYGAKARTSDYPPLLKAADISKPVTLTIASVVERELKGERKLILGFKERGENMVVNRTNVGELANRFGDVEPSELVGKTIMLASVPTTYQGQATKGIRIVG